MKKRSMKVFLFLVCITVYVAFLMTLTINVSTPTKENNTNTSISNFSKERNYEKDVITGEIKYKYVQNISDLVNYTSQVSTSEGGVPLIIIGLNGNYIVEGVDTGITSYTRIDSFGEKGAYVLFVENTGETDNELIYSILYSNNKVKEFKIDKETNEISSNYKIDIQIGENGNWYINGNDTGISSTESGYDTFNEDFNRNLSKEDWLKLLNLGLLDLNEYVNIVFYPENGDYPYTLKYVKGSKFVNFSEPTIDGYTFMGWLNDENKFMECGKDIINCDIELHAIYKQNDYMLTLNSNNGEQNKHMIVHYNDEISLYTPTKDGFEFLGWYYNDELQNGSYCINEDACYVANWCPIYTLNKANSDSVLCNSILTIKDLSLFDGWYCDDMLALYPDNQVIIRTMTSMDLLDRASSTSSVINDETKLDIVGETKSKKTAMIQELDYESEPRYYVRT